MHHRLVLLLTACWLGSCGHAQVLPTVEPLGNVVPARLLSDGEKELCRARYFATRVGNDVIVTAHGAHRSKGVTVQFETISATPELLVLQLLHAAPPGRDGAVDSFAVSVRVSMPARAQKSSVPFRVQVSDANGSSEVEVGLASPH